MNVPRPGSDSYTIYSKSGCLYCTKAKGLLQNERVPPLVVNCDKFLLENKVFYIFLDNISSDKLIKIQEISYKLINILIN